MSTAQKAVIEPTLLAHTESGSDCSSSIGSPTNGLKRPAEGEPSCFHASKGRRSSEEEKLARRLARQQRNRKSAQVSREKKKAYVDQLEQEVVALRQEKQLYQLRDAAASKKRVELEEKVDDLSSKVRHLESLLGDLVKRSSGTILETTSANMHSVRTEGETSSFKQDVVTEPMFKSSSASAAPAALSTLCGASSSALALPTLSTHLPAAEVTNSSTEELAQQWVLSQQSALKPAKFGPSQASRQRQQPMAAALLLTSLNAALHTSPTKLTPLSCGQTQACLPLLSQKAATPSIRPLSTGLPMQPMLKLRFKIPHARVQKVLEKYSQRPVTV